jgi:hypothetical protein
MPNRKFISAGVQKSSTTIPQVADAYWIESISPQLRKPPQQAFVVNRDFADCGSKPVVLAPTEMGRPATCNAAGQRFDDDHRTRGASALSRLRFRVGRENGVR